MFNTYLPPGMVPGAKSITDIYIYTLAQIRPLHCKISSLALMHSATSITSDKGPTSTRCTCTIMSVTNTLKAGDITLRPRANSVYQASPQEGEALG